MLGENVQLAVHVAVGKPLRSASIKHMLSLLAGCRFGSICSTRFFRSVAVSVEVCAG